MILSTPTILCSSSNYRVIVRLATAASLTAAPLPTSAANSLFVDANAAKQTQQQLQQHKRSRRLRFRGRAAARRSREDANAHHNGGGSARLGSDLSDGLQREDTLWCRQEELWESTPRDAPWEHTHVSRSL